MDCKEIYVNYLIELGKRKEIQGIKKRMKLRPITANQLGKCIRKVYHLYVDEVGHSNDKKNDFIR